MRLLILQLKGNSTRIICKLNIKRAYKHVNWNFVLVVLEKMGFGSKWINWIRWCISIVRSFVLVNGFHQVSSKGV